MKKRKAVILLSFWVYCFLISINIMGHGFKALGSGFVENLISITSNPFISLIIGIFGTSIVQSSSTTTSIIVSFVASGTLSLDHAIPMVMGANIGTSVTNTIISLAHIKEPDEFERAFSAATIHDFFNFLTVCLLLPLEIMTGFLKKSALMLSSWIYGTQVESFHGPLFYLVKPIPKYIKSLLNHHLPESFTCAILIILGLTITFISLISIVRIMKKVFLTHAQSILDKSIQKHAILALIVGCLITMLIQSSSITTSLLVPLAASGMISIQQVYPITLGANLGTTWTAILAALGSSSGVYALAIALVHLLFNLSGIMIFFPFPWIRKIPINLSIHLAKISTHNKLYGLGYILGVFYLFPIVLILIWSYLA